MPGSLMSHSVESVVVQHPVYGFFGKVPTVGDFVQRNLATPVAASVDAWLQEGMYLLGQQGQTFHDRYMISPIGFFVLPQRVWADQAVAGFIMPSVDRVGRLFPFVFLQSLTGDQPINLGRLSHELERTSDIAIHAVQQRLSPDELYQHLLAATATTRAAADVPAADTDVYPSFSIDGSHSLWWRSGDAGVDSIKAFDTTNIPGIFSFLYL